MRRALFVALLFVSCKAASPPPHSIFSAVVIGDSVAHGAGDERGRGIARDLDDELHARGIRAANTRNLGINGARTGDVLRLLDTTSARDAVATADLVIVSIGGNDLYGDSFARFFTMLWPEHAMERTLDRITIVVASIRRANPTARIALLGLYDPYRKASLDRAVNRWDARLIDRFAGAANVDVIRIEDLFHVNRLSPIDHFHPSGDGYLRIARRIAESF